jgi:hypothetical protein
MSIRDEWSFIIISKCPKASDLVKSVTKLVLLVINEVKSEADLTNKTVPKGAFLVKMSKMNPF